ncbi:hypothetical protein ACFE04_019270 [Oxalis oulophora]
MATEQEKRHRSIFDVPANFFDGCRLISPSALSSFSSTAAIEPLPVHEISGTECLDEINEDDVSKNGVVLHRMTCNTCKAEFESLQEQRSHFKSDIHRFNVKLCLAGKDIIKEEDFDELTFDSSKDFDVSSISGSDNEDEKVSRPRSDANKSVENVKQKLFVCLRTGEKASIWKSLILNESESVLYENDKSASVDCYSGCVKENDVISRLKILVHEPRDKTSLRVVLLAVGGHFAGGVFDGNTVVAHKTFHRYVVRGNSGKKQSAKDGGGKIAHSAGSSLRRYNELALKKEIQELLTSWKTYFDASSCIFIHAPSSNRQLFFEGDKPNFCHKHSVVRNIPFSARRPTLKEARRIYTQMTQIYEINEKEISQSTTEDTLINVDSITDANPAKEDSGCHLEHRETSEASINTKSDKLPTSSDCENEVIGIFTPLHEAAQSGSIEKVLELLEQGLDPCIKDQRGRTPYMVADEKEVRNTFRRFMASNLDKWDWHAAKVPSALTKEMEESQAAKQAEKDAKKKARAKELKKLRKAKEKKAQAVESSANPTVEKKQATPSSISQGLSGLRLSKEEELKRAAAIEREKRAAAAERRMASASASAAASNSTTTAPPPRGALTTDILCSCCNGSLLGKVPFHRFNYKYCSTTCMHLHKEFLEDG